MVHAREPRDRRRVVERPADEDELRAERERLQHVRAAPNAAIHHHHDAER